MQYTFADYYYTSKNAHSQRIFNNKSLKFVKFYI